MRCSRCGTENAPQNYYCKSCGAVLQDQGYVGVPAYEQQSGSGGTLKMVLIGLGIGIGVLGIVFSVILFLNKGNDSEPVSTLPTTTVAATTEYVYIDRDDDQQSDRDYDDYYDDVDDYSAYRTEAQLYSRGAPQILPESSSEYITVSDLAGLNEDQVQKAINDIYARNGKIFDSDLFSNYYYDQSWYYPVSKDADEIRAGMNEVERKNIETMTEYNR